MYITSLLPHIPIAALVLLVFVTIFIGFEVYSLVKPKSSKKKTDSKKPIGPDAMKPLKFPKVSNPKVMKDDDSDRPPISRKLIGLVIGFAVLIGTLAGGYYYITANNIPIPFLTKTTPVPLITGSPNPSSKPSVSHVPTYNAQFLLYLETEEDAWKQISEDELSTLKQGDVIRIALRTEEKARRVDITVNDEPIPLATGLSPEGDSYARYIIPRNESEYKVAARVY